MPSLYTEIDINAPQGVVWDTLVRKDQWRFWNTFLYDCDPGLRLARGNEIFLAMQRLEGDEETEFQPVITMMRPPYMMRWVSTIPGLRSEHVFELRENMPGRTHYVHREVFSGILSKVFLPFIRQDERQGLRRMAQQLKMHVENTILGDRPPAYRPDVRSPYDAQPRYDDRYYRGDPNGGYDPRNDYPRNDDYRPRRR
ncbi:MAG: SRPBCC domain-containing protein [Cyanobacteria bacterium J06560_2]